eukprot:g2632.t1
MEEFRHIPTKGFRYCQAKRIVHKYIRVNEHLKTSLDATIVLDAEREKLDQLIETAKKDKSVLTNEMFSKVHHRVFRKMAKELFLPMKMSGKYDAYEKEKRETYNQVCVDDFDFLEFLGRGGFGKVVRVRKKSTGLCYAMKIEEKLSLMQEFRDDRDRVTIERDVLCTCDFPFIIGLQYAFQNDRYLFLLLDLAEAGDLKQLMKANRGILPRSAVRFFCAEVLLALHHLHEMNLIYRDLKPANVLVSHDGHVKLADMGLAGVYVKQDFDYTKPTKKLTAEQLRQKEEQTIADGIEHADARNLAKVNEIDHSLNRPESTHVLMKHSKKRTSVVGTFGYKAPEMFDDKYIPTGYGPSVDFWSLGIMMFNMLYNRHPFGLYGPAFDHTTRDEVAAMQSEISFPEKIDEDMKECITHFLVLDPRERLGTGGNGFQDVLDHPFFAPIDWVGLMLREVRPPHVPAEGIFDAKRKMDPMFKDWDDFQRQAYPRSEDPAPNSDHLLEFEKEIYRQNWNYVSPSTVKAELGMLESYNAQVAERTKHLMELEEEHDKEGGGQKLAKKLMQQNHGQRDSFAIRGVHDAESPDELNKVEGARNVDEPKSTRSTREVKETAPATEEEQKPAGNEEASTEEEQKPEAEETA